MPDKLPLASVDELENQTALAKPLKKKSLSL